MRVTGENAFAQVNDILGTFIHEIKTNGLWRHWHYYIPEQVNDKKKGYDVTGVIDFCANQQYGVIGFDVFQCNIIIFRGKKGPYRTLLYYFLFCELSAFLLPQDFFFNCLIWRDIYRTTSARACVQTFLSPQKKIDFFLGEGTSVHRLNVQNTLTTLIITIVIIFTVLAFRRSHYQRDSSRVFPSNSANSEETRRLFY